MIYALDEEHREQIVQRAIERRGGRSRALTWSCGCQRDGKAEAGLRSARGELRFAPGGDLVDERGGHWSVEGELAALGAEVTGRALPQP